MLALRGVQRKPGTPRPVRRLRRLRLAAVSLVLAFGTLVVTALVMVLVATGPITAAGLVNEGTRAWFWKAFRWFHVAAFTPLLVVIVTVPE